MRSTIIHLFVRAFRNLFFRRVPTTRQPGSGRRCHGGVEFSVLTTWRHGKMLHSRELEREDYYDANGKIAYTSVSTILNTHCCSEDFLSFLDLPL
jgi:hypothetical protein